VAHDKIIVYVFSLQLEENCPSDVKFFQYPLINTTITRCLAIFINLSTFYNNDGLLAY